MAVVVGVRVRVGVAEGVGRVAVVVAVWVGVAVGPAGATTSALIVEAHAALILLTVMPLGPPPYRLLLGFVAGPKARFPLVPG